jgi:hypothetical protein
MIPEIDVELDKYGRSFIINIQDKMPPELNAWILQKLNDHFVGISIDNGVKYSIKLYANSQLQRLIDAGYIAQMANNEWITLRPLIIWRK